MSKTYLRCVQGGDDPLDALNCRSFFAQEPIIIGLFCGKWPVKMRHPMDLRHSVPTVGYNPLGKLFVDNLFTDEKNNFPTDTWTTSPLIPRSCSFHQYRSCTRTSWQWTTSPLMKRTTFPLIPFSTDMYTYTLTYKWKEQLLHWHPCIHTKIYLHTHWHTYTVQRVVSVGRGGGKMFTYNFSTNMYTYTLTYKWKEQLLHWHPHIHVESRRVGKMFVYNFSTDEKNNFCVRVQLVRVQLLRVLNWEEEGARCSHTTFPHSTDTLTYVQTNIYIHADIHTCATGSSSGKWRR